MGDGCFRFLDPARAAEMLAGVVGLPDGATVLGSFRDGVRTPIEKFDPDRGGQGT